MAKNNEEVNMIDVTIAYGPFVSAVMHMIVAAERNTARTVVSARMTGSNLMKWWPNSVFQ